MIFGSVLNDGLELQNVTQLHALLKKIKSSDLEL